MSELNTEQIIKALEHCSANTDCKLCSYHKCIACVDILLKDVLALIKEQQNYIENLKKENQYLRESLADEREHKEDMKGTQND